jgi:putative flippase GtrA
MLQETKEFKSYFIKYFAFGCVTSLSCLAFGYFFFRANSSSPFVMINFYSGVFGVSISFCLNFFWNFNNRKKVFLSALLRFVFTSFILLTSIVPITLILHYLFEGLLSIAFEEPILRLILHALALTIYFIGGFLAHYYFSFNPK